MKKIFTILILLAVATALYAEDANPRFFKVNSTGEVYGRSETIYGEFDIVVFWDSNDNGYYEPGEYLGYLQRSNNSTSVYKNIDTLRRYYHAGYEILAALGTRNPMNGRQFGLTVKLPSAFWDYID